MLGLYTPTHHLDVFDPLVDYHILDTEAMSIADVAEFVKQASKPIWFLSYGGNLCIQPYIEKFEPVGVVVAPDLNPDIYVHEVMNLQAWIEAKGYATKAIPIWQGSLRHLDLLASKFKILGLAHDVYPPRGVLMEKADLTRFDLYYSDFTNMDELRCKPPWAMHTSAPITAALKGIELATRERRPRNLKSRYNQVEMQLTDGTLELALRNLKDIAQEMP